MIYYLVTGAAFAISAWLIGQHTGGIKTSKCLKCEEGVGRLQQSGNGKHSYKCDNCESIWVERK